MKFRNSFLALALAGSFGAPLVAQSADINFNVDIAPPAPVYEQLPPREGYVVTPGYYRYDTERHAHTWVKGEYQPARKGEHWVAPEWREQNGRYGFVDGRWEHDKGQ